MKKSGIVWTIIIVIIVIAVIIWVNMGSGSSSSSSATPAANTPSATSVSTPVVSQPVTTAATSSIVLNKSISPSLGSYLAATNGMTLYVDSKDAVGASVCYGSCATEWPPYIVSTSSVAYLMGGPGVTQTIGTITRTDGSLQLTYKGKPLYFWQGDKEAGDTTGQSVGDFLIAQP
jgi:predicted lipoprotein with Yx(FWY)xxD motif